MSNPTAKDYFVKKISKEIFNYPKKFGVLTFTVKFNSGVASSLTISSEEKISLETIHAKDEKIKQTELLPSADA
jgi:hypothetical protein